MNKQIVESLYAGFAEGNVPKVLGLMDEKIEWIEADGFPITGTYIGPQAVLEGVFMRLGEIGEGWSAVPDQLIAEGDTVVALGKYAWKHKVTGKVCEVKMAHAWTLSGGKITRLQQHVDTAQVRELSA
jgi:uncharacterized protein